MGRRGSSVTTLDRPKASGQDDPLSRLAEVKTAPEGRWRLHMALRFTERSFDGLAELDFFTPGGLFAGRAPMVIKSDRGGSGTTHVDVEGEAGSGGVRLDLHMLDPAFPHPGFTCEGAAKGEGRYQGGFFMECVNPQACGCGGTKGPFTLERLS